MIINPIKSTFTHQNLHTEAEKNQTKYVSNPFRTDNTSEISFKAFVKIGENNPYKKGYEDIITDNEGKITNKSKYLVINSPKDLDAISKSPTAFNKYYTLSCDIDMDGFKIEPIGDSRTPFTGIFDGNGFAVKNLKISSRKNDSGMFGVTENAKIKNLKVENISVSGENDVGTLIGNSLKTEIYDCDINGKVIGRMCIGGLIGASESSKIENVKFSGYVAANTNDSASKLPFETSQMMPKVESIGGIIGFDNASKMNGVYTDCKVNADTTIGGFAGTTSFMRPTIIEDCVFEGELISSKDKGAAVGNSANTLIKRFVSLKYNPVGKGSGDCTNCITDIKEVFNVPQEFDNNYWIYKKKRLPRLKTALDLYKPIDLYMTDVNISRLSGEIIDGSQKYKPVENLEIYLPIKEPIHLKKNEPLLSSINSETNPDELAKMFAEYTCEYFFNPDINKYDELVLALVKNPNLDVNKPYEGYGVSVFCSPLYIASRIERPYIFAEILKRNDIKPELYCGTSGISNIFDTMMEIPDDKSAYAMYSSDNPIIKDFLTKKIAQFKGNSPSNFVNILNKMYPNIPLYSRENMSALVPLEYCGIKEDKNYYYDSNNIEMRCPDDVLRNMDIPLDYTDINNNNIINAIVESDNELYALSLFKKAQAIGVNPDNKNTAGFTPFTRLLETEKNQSILSELLKLMPESMYQTNSYGENAIHIFSKNPDETKSIRYISEACKLGMSVNLQDNHGVTALMNTITNKKHNLFNFLIANRASVRMTDSNGQNALHYACLNCDSIDDLEFIRILLDKNIDPYLKDNMGFMPFDYLSDDMKMIVNMNQEELDNLYEAGEFSKKIKAVEFDVRAKFTAESGYLNRESSDYKIGKIPKQPFFEKFSPSEDIFSAEKNLQSILLINLLRALSEDNIKRTLSSQGAKMAQTIAGIDNPIATECIEKILSFAPKTVNSVNSFQQTLLMIAMDNFDYASDGYSKQCITDNIDTILEHNPDINKVDSNKQNVLHKICQLNCLYLLSRFLDLNANINQKDILGKNPVEYLSQDLSDKMRNYYENFAISKKLTLGFKNIIRRMK